MYQQLVLIVVTQRLKSEAAVYFHEVWFQVSYIDQVGIACAKVIQGYTYSDFPQLSPDILNGNAVLQVAAFGQLHDQAGGRKSGILQGLGNVLVHRAFQKLNVGQVDGDHEAGILFPKFSAHGKSVADNPFSHRDNKAAFFQYGNEFHGEDGFAAGRLKAQQGFRGKELPVVWQDNGLIVQLKALEIICQCLAETAADVTGAQKQVIVVRPEEVHLVPAPVLCLCEGELRKLHDFIHGVREGFVQIPEGEQSSGNGVYRLVFFLCNYSVHGGTYVVVESVHSVVIGA